MPRTPRRPYPLPRAALPAALACALLAPRPAASQDAGPLAFARVTEGPHVSERTSSGGAVWLDADGDRDADLFVAGGYDVSRADAPAFPNRLFLNDGHGSFTLADAPRLHADEGYSSGPSAADIDADGDPDLLVGNQDGPEFLYRNDGRGGFARIESSPVEREGGPTYATTFADVDGDGRVDALAAVGGLSGPARSRLFRNLGGGAFERWSGDVSADSARAFGPTFVDVDLDGDPDLHLPPTRLFRNDSGRLVKVEGLPAAGGRPHFTPAMTGAWGDYDNDGDFDVYVAHPNGEVNDLFRNEGDWRFTQVTEGWPVLDGGYSSAVAWADLDNDGHLDLVVASWGSPHHVYRNRGDGTFERAHYLDDAPGHASGVTTADVDGDGRLDVYVTHWSNAAGPLDRNALYRNETPAAGGWLRIDLEGTASNRSALGARVRVTAVLAGRRVTQTRELRAAEGWRGQHEPTLHFGLGDADVADMVEVLWPSGATTRLEAVEAGRRLRVVEGG